mmetsp:Transcript_93022/g.287097  ORF Transcript_93022/g.287097 Transcript_93022/m.287097 type:complete len:227 (-) Transcript_93022:73-753(-)
MIESLWLEYTVACGAPSRSLSSPSFCAFCTRAVSVLASWEPIIDASIMACTALRRPSAFSTCNIAAPPLRACLSNTAMARSSAPTTSVSSFSAAAKSASSALRISPAALRSASLVAIFPEVSSISAESALTVEEASSIDAFNSSTCPAAVFTSNCRFLDRSSHHSLNSTYVWCASSPSLMTLACKSVRSWRTCCMGFTSCPACAGTARSAASRAGNARGMERMALR